MTLGQHPNPHNFLHSRLAHQSAILQGHFVPLETLIKTVNLLVFDF